MIHQGSPNTPNGCDVGKHVVGTRTARTNARDDAVRDGDGIGRPERERVPRPDEDEHRDERREEQQLVGERIEQLAQIRDHAVRARELAVDVVGDRGDEEEHEREEAQRPSAR